VTKDEFERWLSAPDSEPKLSDHAARAVKDFAQSIHDQSAAYAEDSSFSFFALKTLDGWRLVSGRIFLNVVPPRLAPMTFVSPNILAGNYPLKELAQSHLQIVANLLKGQVDLPIAGLRFPAPSQGGYSSYFAPILEESRAIGKRVSSLTIRGDSVNVDATAFDWELKASDPPFDSLGDLLSSLGLTNIRDSQSTLEVVAMAIAEIDMGSKISGELAFPAIWLAKGLDTSRASIGYRIFSGGDVVRRGTLRGTDFKSWDTAGVSLRGEAGLEIPRGGVIQCYARFNGVAHHQFWLSDPATFQNSRRAAYEAFDPGLQILRDYLAKNRGTDRDSSDVESAVGWVLWMLGFSCAQLGATKRTRDAPDIICFTPSGGVLVVECTTGTLKAEHKPSHLIDRAAAIRKNLDASGNRQARILPIIVTTKSREEVQADIEQAERHGVLVQTRESLEDLIGRTLTQHNADALFEEGIRQARERKESWNAVFRQE
jgi:hypothetical protein